MNIQHLRYFETIARYENISRASQELMVSQPALSGVLRQLEGELETPLFDRDGKNLKLNQAGRIFLNTTKGILHQLDSSINYLKESKEIAGTLRICVHINCEELFEELGAFCEIYPDVQVRLYPAHELTGSPSLSAFDLVVLPDYEIKSIENSRVQIGKRRKMYVIMSASHPLARRASLKLEELADENFCFALPRDNRLEYAYTYCIEAGFTPKVRYMVADAHFIPSLLRTETCVAFIYNTTIKNMKSEGIVAVPIEGEIPQARRDIFLCIAQRDPSILTQRFFSFVCERAIT